MSFVYIPLCWNASPTLLLIVSCYSGEHENRGGWETDIKQPRRRRRLSVGVLLRARPALSGRGSIFRCREWTNLRREDKEKWVRFPSIWESVLVRAENPFPFPRDLWSGITQEALRWELLHLAWERSWWSGLRCPPPPLKWEAPLRPPWSEPARL